MKKIPTTGVYIKCGDLELMNKKMIDTSVGKSKDRDSLHPVFFLSFAGIKITEDKNLPKKEVRLIGPNGRVLKRYNLNKLN